MSFEIVKQTCKEMMEQRGYSSSEESDYILASNKDDKDNLVIFFCVEPKFNKGKLTYYISKMNEMGLSHCIIVYSDQITSTAKKGIENLDVEIELFSQRELQYNLTKHILVPLHEKLQVKEASIIRKKFGTNLPIISKGDAVVRFYNFKRGDILKITRKEGYIIYRLVK